MYCISKAVSFGIINYTVVTPDKAAKKSSEKGLNGETGFFTKLNYS